MEDKIIRQKIKDIIYLWASIKEENKYSEKYAATNLKIEEKLVDLTEDKNFKDNFKVVMEALTGNDINDPNANYVKLEIKVTREKDSITEQTTK